MNKMLLNSLNSYFKAEKIQVSPQELELQLFSNPHTSSLYAISETLDFLQIDNVAAKVDVEQLTELPTHFIAFIQEEDETPYFAHIKQNGDSIYLSAEKRKMEKERFKKIWNGVILVAEKNKGLRSKTSLTNRWIGILLLFTCFVLFWNNVPLLAFAAIGLFGLYTSQEIFIASNDRDSYLSDKVCGKKDGEGCDQVIKNKKYNIRDFTPNDLLFAFFFSNLLWIALYRDFTLALAVVYGLSFFGILASVVAQAFFLKAWCRLCLLGSGLILIQTLLLSFGVYSKIGIPVSIPEELTSLLLYTLLFGISLLGIYNSRKNLGDNYRLTASEIELMKFKRSPKIVRYILKDAEIVQKPYAQSGLFFGNMESSHTITLILSLSCSFCDKAFRQFYATLQKKSESLRFQLVLNHYDVAPSKFNDVAASILQSYYEHDPITSLDELERWFDLKNPSGFLKAVSSKHLASGYEILTKQRDWCKENGIFQTPVISINESMIPYYYDASFLDDFIDVLHEEIEHASTNPHG